MRGNDAVRADDAVLFSARHYLTGEQKEWAIGIVDQNKMVHFTLGRLRASMAARQRTHSAGLRDGHGPGAQALIEREQVGVIIGSATHYGKDGEITVADGRKHTQVSAHLSGISNG